MSQIKKAQLERLNVALQNSAPDSLNELSKWYKENKNEGKRPLFINSPQNLNLESLKELLQKNGLETGIFWGGSLSASWNDAHWQEELKQLIKNNDTSTPGNNINEERSSYNIKYNIGNREKINLMKLPTLVRDVKAILKSFLVEDMNKFDELHVEVNFQKKMRVIGRLTTYIRLQSVIHEDNLSHILLPLKIIAVQDKATQKYVSYLEALQILDKNIHFFIEGLSHGQVGVDFYSADYDLVLFAEKKHKYKIQFNKVAQNELKKLLQKVPFDVGFDNIFSNENGDAVIIDTEFEGESADQSVKNLIDRYKIN